MAFFKFRVEGAAERSGTTPIAAAVPRPSSRLQHESPKGLPSQELSPERLCGTSSPIHPRGKSEPAGNHGLDGAPIIDPRTRCSKRKMRNFRGGTACIECKNSKTRCEMPPTGVNDKCLRCLRRNKECALYPPTRLASVEHFATQSFPLSTSGELHALQPQNGRPLSYSHGTEGSLGIDSNLETKASAAFSGGFTKPNLSSRPLSCTWRKQLDHRIDSIFSPKTAEQVFHQYLNSFAPKCPIVVFPSGTTATHVRETKPLLFLSILSIASVGCCTVAEQRDLAIEVRVYLADKAVVQGEKSIELVQALQVASFWYRAPDDYQQMNLNQLASITTTMAIDLGLDKIEVSKPAGRALDTWDRMEARRAWLGCFLLSASLSLILRRPNSIAWISQYDDYVADLQRTKASPTDGFLCTLVTTERICHAMNQELFLSDPARSVSISDPKTLMKIQDYQSRIECLPLGQLPSLEKCELPFFLKICDTCLKFEGLTITNRSALVEFGRFASSLYLHELVLHVNHNIDEFKAPFCAKSLNTCDFVDMHDYTPSRLSKLRAIILAAQGLLDNFLRLSVSDMVTLPPHIYGGRVIYAVVLLMKLHKSLTLSAGGINECINADELRLEAYIEHLMLISKSLITKDGRNALSRAFLIIPQLKQWFQAHKPKRPLGSDENKVTGGLQVNTDGGPSGPPIQTPPGTLGDSAIDMQAPENDIIPNHSEPLYGPGSEFDVLDSWFWEFFNVEMLH